jgi:hypothetical protein
MPIRELHGKLEVDTDRGIIYFHVDPSIHKVLEQQQGHIKVSPTPLRICRLQIPDNFTSIDITHGWGASYQRADYADPAFQPTTYQKENP